MKLSRFDTLHSYDTEHTLTINYTSVCGGGEYVLDKSLFIIDF